MQFSHWVKIILIISSTSLWFYLLLWVSWFPSKCYTASASINRISVSLTWIRCSFLKKVSSSFSTVLTEGWINCLWWNSPTCVSLEKETVVFDACFQERLETNLMCDVILNPAMCTLSFPACRNERSRNKSQLWLTFRCWFLITCCVPLRQNAQRLAAGAQVAQTLTTPVVSVATPSLLAQGLPFSAMPTAYNTGEVNENSGSEKMVVLPSCFWYKCNCSNTHFVVTFVLIVLSQSTSWPVQTSLLYTLWHRLAACCPPACPHGNSSRLFPSNRCNSSSSSKHNSSNNLTLHHSATWCKSCSSFYLQQCSVQDDGPNSLV